MKKANTQENIRGAWITRHEIHQLRNDVSREIKNEKNPQQNESNNADVAIEGEHVDLPHNIIPPEENAIEQPNEINENEFSKIKKTLANVYPESIITPFDKRFNLRNFSMSYLVGGSMMVIRFPRSLSKNSDCLFIKSLFCWYYFCLL